MRSLLLRKLNGVASHIPIALPGLFVTASAATAIGTPPAHSLLINAVAWGLVWIYSTLKVGLRFEETLAKTRRLCLAAGCLLALAQVCERGPGSRGGLWWAKAWLPATVYAIIKASLNGDASSVEPSESSVNTTKTSVIPSLLLLVVATISACAVLGTSVIIPHVAALGLCYTLALVTAFVFLENAFRDGRGEKRSEDGGLLTPNDVVPGRVSAAQAEADKRLMVIRDLCFTVSLGCAVASFTLEDFSTGAQDFRSTFTDMSKDLRTSQLVWALGQGALTIIVSAVGNISMIEMIRQYGALRHGCFALTAALCAQLTTLPTLGRFWFSSVCVAGLYYFCQGTEGSKTGYNRSMRTKRASQLLTLVALGSFAALGINGLRRREHAATMKPTAPVEFEPRLPEAPWQPLQVSSTRVHPIDQLIKDAEQKFEVLKTGQSGSLAEAVAEYRRRYKIHPPPKFDKWYEFATARGVQLIDEYDAIYDTLLPFWSLKPKEIRARVREAIGYSENFLISVLIRNRQIATIDDGPEWQREATAGMIDRFIEFLPDMDLAFNIHDEPRVIVPYEDLTRMVAKAKDEAMPEAFSNPSPRNAFSPRPRDMDDGRRIMEVKTTRFNVFAHQPTWTHSKLSCSPESPARAIGESFQDNATAYAVSDLGFLYNHTAFADICNTPSFRETYGFFDRPNAYNIITDLFPVFSQSKVSSYQDILYPSPWYWFGKVQYDQVKDMDWEKKENSLYWRGSTTGGFSRAGGWRRQHRQQVVRKMNALDDAKIMVNKGEPTLSDWEPKTVSRPDYKDIIDVRFSHVGQCDPGDCDAQREFFRIAPEANQQDAWRYKYLLDMDGNAFSGRFYAFLKSKSLVFKMAIFQEWHMNWLKPWVHYIPFSLRGEEWLEAVRYFAGEEEGKLQGPRMATQGREWANKVLRNEDFEAWFFRLLLEYGRLVDDRRDIIGYSDP